VALETRSDVTNRQAAITFLLVFLGRSPISLTVYELFAVFTISKLEWKRFQQLDGAGNHIRRLQSVGRHWFPISVPLMHPFCVLRITSHSQFLPVQAWSRCDFVRKTATQSKYDVTNR
jgi:hypothetical protein